MVEKTNTTTLDVTMRVHRWPRIIAGMAAVYVVFEAGVLEAVTVTGGIVLDQLTPLFRQIPTYLDQLGNWYQQIPTLLHGVHP